MTAVNRVSLHRTIRGTLLYTSKKADRMNEERGREFFTLTKQSDGMSVLLAHCEIDDIPDVVRDITAAFNTASMRPKDGTVRLSIGGKFEGSAWFNFTKDSCELEVNNVAAGRTSHSLKLKTPASWFGNHAIINDGFLSRFFPLDAAPGKIRLENAMMSSPDHRGATGPEMFPLSFGIIYKVMKRLTLELAALTRENFKLLIQLKVYPRNTRPMNVVYCG